MRRLTRSKCAALLFCGLAAAPSPLAAQTGRARVQTAAAPPQGEAPREARPEAENLRVKPVSPQLEAVLNEWYAKTKGITKLQGEHRRFKYEPVFGVAKIAVGKFFYESPDKGRIDLAPEADNKLTDLDPKQAGIQVQGPDLKSVYTLKPDASERWICDGKGIVQIHDTEKTYEVMPIPPQQQGANIMDGPLPFLFGLPPEKAKQRYDMELTPSKAGIILLAVTPKLAQDARNWQRADVMLDSKTFLPKAVRLLHPDGDAVTVFSFDKHEVNPTNIFQIFVGSPFKPALIGYKQVQSEAPAAVQPLNLQGQPIKGLPAVIGLTHSDAKTILGQRGYRQVEMRKGPVTDKPELRYHVAQQSPGPNANVGPNEKIVLTLYVSEEDRQKDAQQK